MARRLAIEPYISTRHGDSVTKLFADIYPHWSQPTCRRMAYDETRATHALTLLAVLGDRVVGHINVWRVGADQELGNLGYHVHPQGQRKGIGSALLSRAWPAIANAFADGLVVQTTAANLGSLALATKAGFHAAPPALVEKYGRFLRFRAMAAGVCLHLARTSSGPRVGLTRAAACAIGGGDTAGSRSAGTPARTG